MSEKRILLASLLKPVNDTRMFEKLGLSVCRLKDVQVHIAGFTAPAPETLPLNLTLHPIFKFKRLSLGRVKAQLNYWQLLQKLKPDLIIVCTHELLLISILYKKLYTCSIIYDVQENYTLNVQAQNNYPGGLKHLLAGGITLSEKLAAKYTDHFLLAERSYAQELNFIGTRYTILENKFKPSSSYVVPDTPIRVQGEKIKLLYTGSISTLYGIFEAVDLTEKWFKLNPAVSLTIIGYCASTTTIKKLNSLLADKPYITLIGGDRLVPHEQILEAIKESSFGLMPYQNNESTYNCIPTKLYEYVALGLPVLIQQNPIWDKLVKEYKAGISLDFNSIDISHLTGTMLNKQFYLNGIPKDVFWGSEEQKLLSLLPKYL